MRNCRCTLSVEKGGGKMIYLQLFWSFLQVGLFSIGGGYAAMPLIQAQMVEKYGWITMNEFADLITIAEMTPGPIAVNSATFVGIRIAGIPGAIVATLGCILPSVVIVSLWVYVYFKYRELSVLESILAALRAAVVALILSAGLDLLKNAVLDGREFNIQYVDWIGAGLFVAAFLILRIRKWNPILVMCLCGVAGLGIRMIARV